ncbi:DUF1127 domain-containing protein [Tropicibacter naphthalenivorans]|uniref:DUF1127 domain-containing protein n=1 Tax=Tropicibacter naphthalenivorans TaxID=441103 RepID=A0A0N7LYK6_9RHOB|nr:DUF1127 domain-containing protein [Tropicibacter naphthalenivorans]CUH75129.1 hypothetical protein TRN7648_00276 [Tropicibacter naphthalenivorans]SMC46150.1 hypothetical protein SAMN04488093_101604 [Tropicibacter naphthalenivorans]
MANVHTAIAPIGNPIAHFFEWVFQGLVRIGEANSRMQKVERLQALSDDQLAKMGLKRENIVQHVFGDIMYV